MTLNRKDAIDFAKKFWNKPTPDGKFWIASTTISIADKRISMKAPASDGWEAFFLFDGTTENAVFARPKPGGGVGFEIMSPPIAVQADLEDCTHYVSLCLKAGGVSVKETPRAPELADQMINSQSTKVLALDASQTLGQKIIDSGIFKPGDMIAYLKPNKNYHHTAMYVGKLAKDDKEGGITCHSTCRFRGEVGITGKAANDEWYLGSGHTYTLVHFSDDDPAISQATKDWLLGWWQFGSTFYHFKDDGRAYQSPHKPTSAQSNAQDTSRGYFFESGSTIIVIWRKSGGGGEVERWTKPAAGKSDASVKIDDFPAKSASPVEFKKK